MAKAGPGPRTISAVIEDIGYGQSQLFTSFIVNGAWLADGAELLVLSSISTTLSAEWDLTAIQRGWLLRLGRCMALVYSCWSPQNHLISTRR